MLTRLALLAFATLSSTVTAFVPHQAHHVGTTFVPKTLQVSCQTTHKPSNHIFIHIHLRSIPWFFFYFPLSFLPAWFKSNLVFFSDLTDTSISVNFESDPICILSVRVEMSNLQRSLPHLKILMELLRVFSDCFKSPIIIFILCYFFIFYLCFAPKRPVFGEIVLVTNDSNNIVRHLASTRISKVIFISWYGVYCWV